MSDVREIYLTQVDRGISDPPTKKQFEHWRRDLILQLPEVIKTAVSRASMTSVGLRGDAVGIASGVPTILSWSTTDYNNGAATMFDPATPDRLIAPLNGLYDVYASVEWEYDGAGSRSLQLIENAANVALDIDEHPPTQPNPPLSFPFSSNRVGRRFVMVAGDYVRVRAFQNSGVTLNLVASAQAPIFGLTRLAAFP